MIRVKTSRAIIPVTMSRKMYSASTWAANVDACCGHNGKLLSIPCLRYSLSGYRAIQPPQDKDQTSKQKNRGRGRQAQDVRHHGAVFSGLGIIVIAVEEHCVDSVANFALRGFDQSHSQIFGRKIHTVKVTRD